MSSESNPAYVSRLPAPRRSGRLPLFFVSVLLLVEFLDEIMDGVGGAAWPLIRDDLGLSYAEVGVLLSVPSFISCIVEPFMGILADVWRRRVLALAGGVAFTLSVDELVIAYFTAGTAETFPIKVYSMVRFSVTPEVNAVSALLILLTVVLTTIALKMQDITRSASAGAH